MCARAAQQQTAEQNVRQAENVGRMRLMIHSVEFYLFSVALQVGSRFSRFLLADHLP